MNSAQTDFNANIAIVNPSPLTAEMMSDLPSNYTQSQTSNNFSMLYGTGYEFENVKQTLQQLEANNYLFSPDVQNQTIKVDGAGVYLVEFQIPFVTPPLNVNIVGSSLTDVFIEYTSRFNMIINVQTDIQDVLTWTASGFVGAASDQYLGDALYDNFGALYNFPRLGDSQINASYVNQYMNTNLFVSVETITPVEVISVVEINDELQAQLPRVFNPPPAGVQFYRGIIQPTSVVSFPQATNELRDDSGNLIALLGVNTTTQNVTSFYPNVGNNIYKSTQDVFVTGFATIYNFDAWDQPAYVQEVFRADNVYRRLLAGINKSLQEGPSINGLANMVETLFAQPYIPLEYWKDSDFRVFKDSLNLTFPKYELGTEFTSQYDGYPTAPPTVEVMRVTAPWEPGSITFQNMPVIQSLDTPVTQEITILNQATRFDIADELIRELRLGLNIAEGGVIDWNYAMTSPPSSGFPLYETYNYFFLNSANASYANLNLFWYAYTPYGYTSYGPLQFGQDYFVVPTSQFFNPTFSLPGSGVIGGYNLPSELLQNYNVNSTIPFQGTNTYHTVNSALPPLPQFMIQLAIIYQTLKQNGISTNFPTNTNDFIFYSYGAVTTSGTSIDGTFSLGPSGMLVAYYDAYSAQALQPSDSPFLNGSGGLSATSFAQGSFAKFMSTSNYNYVLNMDGGQVNFNKTLPVESLFSRFAVNDASVKNPAIFNIQALQFYTVADFQTLLPDATQPFFGPIGTTQFYIQGTLQPMNKNGINYLQVQLNAGNYVILDNDGNLLAVLTNDSTISQSLPSLVGQELVFSGVVNRIFWDTRVPVTQYRGFPPIYQVASNYGASVVGFTPDPTQPISVNMNFLAIIPGLPLGNQQTVTANWNFNIQSSSIRTSNNSPNAIGFPDLSGPDNTVIPGIMSIFTGYYLRALVDNVFIDIDNSTYEQTYITPSISSYFLNYLDYINVLGSKLTPSSDSGAIDTLTAPFNLALNNYGSVLNFFSPQYGVLSFAIFPNMEFFQSNNGVISQIIRPNNQGVALQIQGDSYAGLVFYGTNQTTIVDKPTRLIVDFTYTLANLQNRKKIVEIEDGGFANWVNASQPNKVMTGEVFYLTGDKFKFPHLGLDQSINQYTDTYSPSGILISPGNAPGQAPVSGPFYWNAASTPDPVNYPPVFAVDPSLSSTIDSGVVNAPGEPMRYRRVAQAVATNSTGQLVETNYTNYSPEKISFLQFDLDSFPYDTIVNDAVLEVYFASGFTIREAKKVNFSLNDTSGWDKARLSGNGLTELVTTNTVPSSSYLRPVNNVHWRQNYFEITLPYAFMSEPTDFDYGIRNIFGGNTNTNMVAPTNPQPNLEYLGFINIDEIDTSSLMGPTRNDLIEVTVGLANIILSQSSIIYEVNGILTFNPSSSATGIDVVQSGSQIFVNHAIDSMGNPVYYNTITMQTVPFSGIVFGPNGAPLNPDIQLDVIPTQQTDIVLNQKVLVFPYGLDSNLYFYGYTKAILPSYFIGFSPTDIAIYQKAFGYIVPIYTQYVVKLLEADTYFPYTTFGRDTSISNTPQDISF